MRVRGHDVDDALLRVAAQRGRQTGRVFSPDALIARVLARGDAIDEASVLRAVDSFEQTRLPPQEGLRATERVVQAAHFGWSATEAQAEAHQVDAVPEGFGRVVLERRGSVATGEQEFISAYWQQRSDGRLAPLKAENTVYFGTRKLGAPDRFFGPYALDRRGVPLTDADPLPPAATADALTGLSSQGELAGLSLAKLSSPGVVGYDWLTAGDSAAYQALSAATAQRLTPLQRRELEALTGYGGPRGNVAPQVNSGLRRGRADGPHVQLLDGALQRALTLPTGVRLFRGAQLLEAELKVGAVVVDAGFQFSTLEPSLALRFAKQQDRAGERVPAVLVIDVASPLQGLVSGNVGEAEVVLPRDLPLTVKKVTHRDGVAYVLVSTQQRAP